MGTVIIDARSFKFLPEALEACRLSAVDTVVLTPCDLKLSTRYAGVLWAIQEDNMSLKVVRCTNRAESVIDGARVYAMPRDLMVTNDIGVAAFAIKKGASAIDHRGRPFDPRTIQQDLSERDRERLLRSMGIFPPCQNEPALDASDARRLAREVEAFASLSTPHKPQASRYNRILVDADNLPTTRILPVARTLGIPVSSFHDETNDIGTRLLQTDPISNDESTNGFWVEQAPIPSGEHAVDMVMIERARKGDFVLTNDGPLAYKCLEIGCAVMDRYGAFHEPEEYPYFPTESIFRQSRHVRNNAIKHGLNENERATEFMKRLHSALSR